MVEKVVLNTYRSFRDANENVKLLERYGIKGATVCYLGPEGLPTIDLHKGWKDLRLGMIPGACWGSVLGMLVGCLWAAANPTTSHQAVSVVTMLLAGFALGGALGLLVGGLTTWTLADRGPFAMLRLIYYGDFALILEGSEEARRKARSALFGWPPESEFEIRPAPNSIAKVEDPPSSPIKAA